MKKIINICALLCITNLVATKNRPPNPYKSSSHTKTKTRRGTVHTIGSGVATALTNEGNKIYQHTKTEVTKSIRAQKDQFSNHAQQQFHSALKKVTDPVTFKIHQIIQGGINYANAGIYYTGAGINKGINFLTSPLDPYLAKNHDTKR